MERLSCFSLEVPGSSLHRYHVAIASLIRGNGLVTIEYRRSDLPYVLIPLIYFVALFPSRNHWDTVEILRLARNGQSIDQWTALYFRYLQIISAGGHLAFLPSAIGLIGLVFGCVYFVESLPLSKATKRIATLISVGSPFVGVFGMTLTHEVQTVTGTLILSGILLRKFSNSEEEINKVLVGFAIIYCLMTFVGLLIVFGFFLALTRKHNMLRNSFVYILIFLFSFMSGSLLFVDKVNPATNFQSFLGDVKCIVQHPDAVISEIQWNELEKLGPKEKWLEARTCSSTAEAVMFVAPNFPGKEVDFLKLWAQLVKQNPQIALQARIQRSAMALPPPFFQSQPNFSSKDYLEPVGTGTQDDLQQWSPLFKTSNDDPYQLEHLRPPSFLKPLEFIALLPAFILNSQSWLWGWGGLWIVVFAIILLTRTRMRLSDISRVLLPHFMTIVGLFVGSPVSDPRYAMSLTVVGIFTSIAFLADYFVRRRSSLL